MMDKGIPVKTLEDAGYAARVASRQHRLSVFVQVSEAGFEIHGHDIVTGGAVNDRVTYEEAKATALNPFEYKIEAIVTKLIAYRKEKGLKKRGVRFDA